MSFKRQALLLIATFLLTGISHAFANEGVEEFSHEETIRLGERMYRAGILPSGQPMKAIVMGDIPVKGTMFTCDDCHQRSGLGSEEGTIITWPTSGKELFVPRRRDGAYKPPVTEEEKQNVRRQLPKYYEVPYERPAYTDKTLAKVIRLGVDSAGKKLDRAMPKYPLSKRDMAILIYYLKHLSVENAPGVDESTLHFATVITDEVPQQQREAMLSVLQAHIDARNVQSRHEGRRFEAGPFYKSQHHRAYRKLILHRWVLSGSEDTWTNQLEKYYENQPVFSLLGGITTGSWEKIHQFSEKNKLPCIFPLTDLPAISDSDWYTIYFSQGYYQEGKSAANFLKPYLKKRADFTITHIFKKGDKKAIALAKGFDDTWKELGGSATVQKVITSNKPVGQNLWEEILSKQDKNILFLWLDSSDSGVFSSLESHLGEVELILSSAHLMGSDFAIMPNRLREKIFFTYPYDLPGNVENGRRVVDGWLKAREIDLIDFPIQSKMYFLGWMLPGALKSMRSEFFREYFLERFDMMTDQDYAIPIYPRLTFGPGQRYASKGCYVVQLAQEQDHIALKPVTDWIIY